MKFLVKSLLCVAIFWSAAAAEDITIERVVGPEVPAPYKHPATIAEFDNGDLYIAYYGGEGEYQGDTKVYGMRLAKGSTKWTTPEVIADTPDRSEGNACALLTLAADGDDRPFVGEVEAVKGYLFPQELDSLEPPEHFLDTG